MSFTIMADIRCTVSAVGMLTGDCGGSGTAIGVKAARIQTATAGCQ
jgi:hypothetical protein